MLDVVSSDTQKAHAIAVAAFRLHERLTASGGVYTERAQYRLLDLCNAVIDLIDDGDCLTQRENLMWELRCDEYGNPVPPDESNIDDSFWRESAYALERGMGD